LLVVQGAFAAVSKIAYGPKNCITLNQSSEGTCVIKTNCNGVNLDSFEFAFDCTTAKQEVERHSFGFGGFDAQEEFDTSVKCTVCEPPTDQHHVLVGTGSSKSVNQKTVLGSTRSNTDAVQKSKSVSNSASNGKKVNDGSQAKKDSSEAEKVVKYGPNECVSTYRNPAGHCVMQTQCAKENITDYEFGLICVDKTGEPVRHVFGKDSFDTEESFDTLIACEKCVGLDDIADETSLVKQVESLTSEVENMNKTLSTLRTSVKKLKGEVFKAPAPAPAPSGLVKVSSSTKEESVSAHTGRKHMKLHLKSSRKHRSHEQKIQNDEAADADNDQERDQDQDQDDDQDRDQDEDQDNQEDDSEDA